MANIRVMDELLANKIAAGEVVERIVSIVKELVENSIDAHSSEVVIELKEAGLREIKITDNGIGMDKEDARCAFLRHATSKLYDEDDLFNICSLGFRGEALPSIAAVSWVELKTSTGSVGTKLTINGGVLEKEENSDARRGTEITIKNLFYNTPARLKYLNSLHTELANIAEYINKTNNTNLTAENIYMTVGACASLSIVIKAIANKGDEIIVFAPFLIASSIYS